MTNYYYLLKSDYKEFGFDDAARYKFYILTVKYELLNKPKPMRSNSGGWLYRLNDLKEAIDYVHTMKNP
ncbi:hypothetical protein CR203_06135 [Salipaludibacillus neizhouensis]|uniref:Uncharacterized protein n=1 Tax=Salipaludibacillus neizhouensis TaxID=885475 RepID=A0A3A9KEK9_9BACI|nr:hypothetical protein CR203_06135 [Salipaludibacillus neizhouensis]